MWIAVAVWIGVSSGGADVARQLAALTAPSVAERAAAERWLAERMTSADYPQVAGFVAQADAEAQARVTQALSASDVHLELAALLAADDAPYARSTGESALRRMVARWSGVARLEPRAGAELWEELSGRFEDRFALEVGAADLDQQLEWLARAAPTFLGELGAPKRVALVLDPLLFEHQARARAQGQAAPARGASWREGAFDFVLRELASAHNAEVAGFGTGGDRPWLWIHAPALGGEPGAVAGPATTDGAAAVCEWCRSVVLGRERTRGEAAARALAQCGWPAALDWLARLWLERGDVSALSGVLLAAARGQIAPALMTSSAFAGLLAEFERRERENSGPRLERFQREFAAALARFPGASLEGVDLAALTAQWAERPERVQCALEILSGMRRAPATWRESLPARVRSGNPRERFLALRAAGALGAGAGSAWDAPFEPEFFAHWIERRGDLELLEHFELARCAPRIDASSRSAFAASSPQVRALWIDAALVGGAPPEALAACVREWLDESTPVDALGGRWAQRVRLGDGARVERAIDIARAGSSGASAERARRLDLLAGSMPMLERQRCFELLAASGELSAEDWTALGAIAWQGPSPQYAEFVLEQSTRALERDRSLDAPWVAAFAQAHAGLAGRGELNEAEALLRRLWVVVRRSRHPLEARMQDGQWPPPPGPPARVLAGR